MKPNLLPVSTAKWDPIWYHNINKYNCDRHVPRNYGQYLDKNNVLNGTRIENLVFPEERWTDLDKDQCSPTCQLKDTMDSKHWCPFMKSYLDYLTGLNFNDMIFLLKTYVENYKYQYNVKGNIDVVLLVHEPSDCKCAERPVLKKWFKQHGITLHEWQGGN